MNKKYHEKFKILDILAVTTQAREGIETIIEQVNSTDYFVTTQAREGIETVLGDSIEFMNLVTTQAREGIETCNPVNSVSKYRCNVSDE